MLARWSKGVKVVIVDYALPLSTESIIIGVDVVISTIGLSALDMHDQIAIMAKDVSVELFVPSEFGKPTDGATEVSSSKRIDATKS